MKFGICNEIFKDWKMEQAMAFIQKIGYDAIEIAPFTLAHHVTEVGAAERRRLREEAARHHLEISAIHWVLVETEGMHMTHPDAAVRKKTQQYFCDLVDFCRDLGAKFIVVGSPQQRNLGDGISFEQGWQWATEVFRPAVTRAADNGVTICLEPLAPSETNFINTAEEAIRFVQQLDQPAFKIILDVKAMSSMGEPIAEIIRSSWPHFAYVHANDANLKGPGFGAVDFKPIARALHDVGYDGYISVEVFNFDEGPETIATKSLEYLKEVFACPP